MAELAALSGDVSSEKLERIADLMGQTDTNARRF